MSGAKGRGISGDDVRSALKLIDDMRRLREQYRAVASHQYAALIEPLRCEIRKAQAAGENIVQTAVNACGKPGASQIAIAMMCAAVMDVCDEREAADKAGRN